MRLFLSSALFSTALTAAMLIALPLPSAAQTAPEATPEPTATAAPADLAPLTLRATVLDHRVLPEIEVDGLKMVELSGMAFDPIPSILYALSDRAMLFSLDFATDSETITALAPVSGVPLTDGDGTPLSHDVFSPEAVTMRRDGPETGTLLIVSETGPRAAVFGLDGRMWSEHPLPEILRDPSGQSGANAGLEAMTELPGIGMLTMPEAPLADAPALEHRIWRADGTSFFYSSDDIGESRVKSMTATPDGQLLMIERTKAKKKLTPHLRLLDPARCTADAACPTAVVPLDIPGIDDADFEGLTRVGDGLYLIVSDDKVKKQQRSVFALIRIELD